MSTIFTVNLFITFLFSFVLNWPKIPSNFFLSKHSSNNKIIFMQEIRKLSSLFIEFISDIFNWMFLLLS